MTAEDLGIPDIPAADEPMMEPLGEEEPTRVLTTATRSLDSGAADVSLSAIASAKTVSLDASGSAVGLATVDGDATASLSAIGIMAAKGNATMRQSYASAFVAGDELSLSQSAAAMAGARTISFERSAAVASVAAETSVRGGFVGLVISGRTDISEDAKVLLTGRAVLIIALALLGGFGLVALALAYGAQRVSAWRPSISLPSWARRS